MGQLMNLAFGALGPAAVPDLPWSRIGRALLAGDVRDGAVIHIGYSDGELTVTYHNQD